MFWQEETSDRPFKVSDDVVDLLFSIECRELPVDHAYELHQALATSHPLIAADPQISVHAIHVAGSQNGWERPQHGSHQHLILSHRTKLVLRTAKAQLEPLLEAMPGTQVKIAGYPLLIGQGKVRPLSQQTTLFSRYIVTDHAEDEEAFLSWAARELDAMSIRVRKAISGKILFVHTPDRPLRTRSLLLADLAPEETVTLQQRGLGSHRQMGCGIFIPHKGVDAVKKTSGD